MNISHKLITLGLAFSLLDSTSAFARPMPHLESGCLSYEKKTARVMFRQQKHQARPAMRVVRQLIRLKMTGRPMCTKSDALMLPFSPPAMQRVAKVKFDANVNCR